MDGIFERQSTIKVGNLNYKSSIDLEVFKFANSYKKMRGLHRGQELRKGELLE